MKTQYNNKSDSNVTHRSLWNDEYILLWRTRLHLYAFFWVIPRRLNFICRRFETLCLFHLHRQVGACRSAYKIQTPGNHPKESIQHLGHGESLKSRILVFRSTSDVRIVCLRFSYSFLMPPTIYPYSFLYYTTTSSF